MFAQEHNPPHFHAVYNEHKAEISILTLEILADSLPKKAYQLVLEWAVEHREELMEDWNRLRNDQEPYKIDPL
jgi:hypothetical protein